MKVLKIAHDTPHAQDDHVAACLACLGLPWGVPWDCPEGTGFQPVHEGSKNNGLNTRGEVCALSSLSALSLRTGGLKAEGSFWPE